MSSFYSLILTQLTVPPGDLIYYTVLVFAVASALQSALNHWRISEFPQARRAYIGLGVLLLAQVIMFLFSGLGWQNIINPTLILPPLDRAFIIFGIICITWLYAFPEPNRVGDAVTVLLGFLVLTALGLSLVTWNTQVVAQSYNHTNGDWFWQVSSLLVALGGVIIIFIRKPDGMWYGIMILTIGALGHVGHLLAQIEGNYSGIVRLAYIAAYPILLTLPQRFAYAGGNGTSPHIISPARSAATAKQETESLIERRRYSTDPKTFQSLLALAAESNPAKISQLITRAIAQTMLADLCFMVYLSDNNNQMVIAGGYDLIREDSLPGGSINKNSIPMLTNALQRGRPLRMPASSTSADIKGIGDIFGLANPGHLLSVPIITPDKETLGGVLLLSPYSDRIWTAEDQAFLTNVTTSLVPIIKHSQDVAKLESQSESANRQVTELERHAQDLTKQLDAARAELQKNASTDVASLRAALEESQRVIEQLQVDNSELIANKNISATTSSSTAQVERELRGALQEIARLQNQMADVNIKAHQIALEQVRIKDPEEAEVITSISQELRQPLSSIIGYTDLLLGESVGILGALQRKFVERIKASTERMNSLADDMIRIAMRQTEATDLTIESIDLNEIIDHAMSYTSMQVREKNISLHIDLPKKMSPIQADRKALQQILIHLLQNAGASTPYEGTMTLKAQTQTEGGLEYMLIQVTDSGVGIPTEDLSRVFTRLYRADNVLIQGVGDTGVGLSIAKTLAEAHGGRIWVDSKVGVGSTFSVLLPIVASQAAGKKPQGKGSK